MSVREKVQCASARKVSPYGFSYNSQTIVIETGRTNNKYLLNHYSTSSENLTNSKYLTTSLKRIWTIFTLTPIRNRSTLLVLDGSYKKIRKTRCKGQISRFARQIYKLLI